MEWGKRAGFVGDGEGGKGAKGRHDVGGGKKGEGEKKRNLICDPW